MCTWQADEFQQSQPAVKPLPKRSSWWFSWRGWRRGKGADDSEQEALGMMQDAVGILESAGNESACFPCILLFVRDVSLDSDVLLDLSMFEHKDETLVKGNSTITLPAIF